MNGAKNKIQSLNKEKSKLKAEISNWNQQFEQKIGRKPAQEDKEVIAYLYKKYTTLTKIIEMENKKLISLEKLTIKEKKKPHALNVSVDTVLQTDIDFKPKTQRESQYSSFRHLNNVPKFILRKKHD